MKTRPKVTHSYIGTVNLFDGAAAAVEQTTYIHDIKKVPQLGTPLAQDHSGTRGKRGEARRGSGSTE